MSKKLTTDTLYQNLLEIVTKFQQSNPVLTVTKAALENLDAEILGHLQAQVFLGKLDSEALDSKRIRVEKDKFEPRLNIVIDSSLLPFLENSDE